MTTLNKMLIGFTAGVVLGVLYAPAKGSKTRSKLSEMGGNIRDGWDNVTDTIAAKLNTAKDDSGYGDIIAVDIHTTQFRDSPDMIL